MYNIKNLKGERYNKIKELIIQRDKVNKELYEEYKRLQEDSIPLDARYTNDVYLYDAVYDLGRVASYIRDQRYVEDITAAAIIPADFDVENNIYYLEYLATIIHYDYFLKKYTPTESDLFLHITNPSAAAKIKEEGFKVPKHILERDCNSFGNGIYAYKLDEYKQHHAEAISGECMFVIFRPETHYFKCVYDACGDEHDGSGGYPQYVFINTIELPKRFIVDVVDKDTLINKYLTKKGPKVERF